MHCLLLHPFGDPDIQSLKLFGVYLPDPPAHWCSLEVSHEILGSYRTPNYLSSSRGNSPRTVVKETKEILFCYAFLSSGILHLELLPFPCSKGASL